MCENGVMKILQVNNVYGEQSTGKLTQYLHEGLLRRGHESVVVYGRGKTATDKNVIRLCADWYGKLNSLLSRLTGIRHGGCLLSTCRLQSIILREKPDVVHIQCINGNFVNIFRIVQWLKTQRIKTVITLHAEFMYTANCGYAFDCDQWKTGCKTCPNKSKSTKSLLFDRTGVAWARMYAAFSGFEKDCVLCPVSPWTEGRAKQSDIMKHFSYNTVYNGVDTEKAICYKPDVAKKENTVLNVTAYFCDKHDHIKGGEHIVELAKRMPDVTFWVAGRADPDVTVPENVILMGEITNQKVLADLYQQATLSVIVSKKETFSMPCAESLCCGTPMVGFKAGAPEQISLRQYSEFVEYGDVDKLECVIRNWLNRNDLDAERIATEAAQVYSSQTMVNKYIDVYRSMIWN